MTLSRPLLLSLAALSLVALASRPVAAEDAPSSEPRAADEDDRSLAPPGRTLSCEGCYAPAYVPPPPGYYTPGYYMPGYAQQQPLLKLSSDELELLVDGEISNGQHVAGVLLSLSPGFGLGQLVQGRWLERGWIFTVGEVAALAVALSSVPSYSVVCDDYSYDPELGGYPRSSCHDSYDSDSEWRLLAGLSVYVGLRVWEVVDAINGPYAHNRRVRALRSRIGQSSGGMVFAPYLTPAREGGAMAGVAARF